MENFPQYRVISGLSTLIKIHAKRLKHYNAAAIRAKHAPLKKLFKKYESHSKESIKTLVGWLVNYGGPSYFPLETREINSLWNKIGNLFYTGEINELLHKSEAIERYALIAHRKALALAVVPPDTTEDIQNQIKNCEEAFATIRMLREKGVNEILTAY
ncbi:MAG TPA: hypothetical protein VK517_03185 [Cyclobacteriaceae bacterium]|jgi:hypothetical protein|nr:hypothetical protein [Cyclobacteriaceae bacterium]